MSFPDSRWDWACGALLRLHPLLRLPWLCWGFAGISVPVPIPVGLWVCSDACQHHNSALGNNSLSGDDAVPNPAPVTTAFVLPTDTELNLFSAMQIFYKGHTENARFGELPWFFFQ